MFDIPLHFNLFVSLIELKNIHSKHPLKEHKSKFKIDKITYSKSQYRTHYIIKNQPSVYPLCFSNFEHGSLNGLNYG